MSWTIPSKEADEWIKAADQKVTSNGWPDSEKDRQEKINVLDRPEKFV
jgi:hypothetical protein